MSNSNKSAVNSILKMWTHPVFLIGAGVIAIVAAATAAYTHYRQQQQYHQYEYQEPRIPQFERRVLGPCGLCKGDASAIDSWQAPCRHYLHYTCSANVTRPAIPGAPVAPVNWSEVCMACVEQRVNRNPRRQSNTGLRNRATRVEECANCLMRITNGEGNSRTMACGHLVHEECWERMQTSASPTCPACMRAA